MPGGASGVLLKSKAPLSCALAETGFRLMRKGWRRFEVVVACSMSQHHRWLERDIQIGAAQNGNEMVFPGGDGMFCYIPDMRRDKLKGHAAHFH
jgi:hypothetical protein